MSSTPNDDSGHPGTRSERRVSCENDFDSKQINQTRVREHRKRLTREEQDAHNEERRNKHSHRTASEAHADKLKRHEARAKRLRNETQEDQEKRLCARRERDKAKRQSETPDARAARLTARQVARRKQLNKCVDCNARLPNRWVSKAWKTRCFPCWKQFEKCEKRSQPNG